MLVIIKATVKETNKLCYKVIATIVEVDKYSDANKCKERSVVTMSMLELFIGVCTKEIVFTKQCNKGFWWVNSARLFNEAANKMINLESAKEYHKADTKVFFDTFGEFYNDFIDRWRAFTANGRKVEVTNL